MKFVQKLKWAENQYLMEILNVKKINMASERPTNVTNFETPKSKLSVKKSIFSSYNTCVMTSFCNCILLRHIFPIYVFGKQSMKCFLFILIWFRLMISMDTYRSTGFLCGDLICLVILYYHCFGMVAHTFV